MQAASFGLMPRAMFSMPILPVCTIQQPRRRQDAWHARDLGRPRRAVLYVSTPVAVRRYPMLQSLLHAAGRSLQKTEGHTQHQHL
jgi:hypothetical protein